MKRLLILLVAIILLISCNSSYKISESEVPQEANVIAKRYIENLLTGNMDYCFNNFDSQYQDEKLKRLLIEAYSFLKSQKLINSSIISYNTTTIYKESKLINYELCYEYEYDDCWLYYTFQIQKKDKDIKVLGINIIPYKNSLHEVNKFTLKNKGFSHFFFLYMMIIIPSFIIVSIIYCFKTPLKRKWLWIIFMLFGIISFRLNWTTGDFELQLLNIRLLGAGFLRSGTLAPWILSFSIPVGAILFWIKRIKVKKQLKSESNESPDRLSETLEGVEEMQEQL